MIFPIVYKMFAVKLVNTYITKDRSHVIVLYLYVLFYTVMLVSFVCVCVVMFGAVAT